MSVRLLHAGPAMLPVLLLALFACAKEPVFESRTEGRKEIRFSDEVTKAGDFFTEGDRIYVWARAEDGTMLMESQEVVLTDGEWTYAPVKYWPLGQSVTFWAITPSAEAFGRPDPESEWLLYRQREDAAAETMTAGPITVPEGQAVRLPFRHILTKVRLLGKTDRPAPPTKSVRIRSVEVSGIPAAGLFGRDGTWSTEPQGTTTTSLTLNQIISGTEYQAVGDLYFIPVPNGSTVTFQVHWDVIYKDSGDIAGERTSSFSRDESFLQQNSAVTFSLALDGRLGLIDFEDDETKRICVQNFDTDGDGEISYEEAAAVTDLGSIFQQSAITRFNELRFFTALTAIGAYAFKDCSGLEAITFPAETKTIGLQAFSGCERLDSVRFPAGLTRIESKAFEDCSSLSTVDLSASSCMLGTGVFQRSGLQSISLPEALTIIPDDTFSDCTDLSSVSYSEPPEHIGIRAFRNCSSLKRWDFRPGTHYLSESFSGAGFEAVDLTGLTESQFGTGVFANCKNLVWIGFGNMFTSIPPYTFQGCEKLYEPNLSSQIISIETGAFKGCTRFTELDFPNTLKHIGSEAFAGCSNVRTIISRAKSAPGADTDAFGSSREDYVGNQVNESKKLKILILSTGYGSGGWDTLLNEAGFYKSYVMTF